MPILGRQSLEDPKEFLERRIMISIYFYLFNKGYLGYEDSFKFDPLDLGYESKRTHVLVFESATTLGTGGL